MSTLQLLSKFTIGGQELKNRIVLAPMTRARCTPGSAPLDQTSTIPNEIMAEYYEQRASGGLLITEATAISDQAYGWLNAPKLTTQVHVEAWKKVTDRVHAAGGIIYFQLWHMGRQSHSSFHPDTNKIVAPSAIKISQGETTTASNEKAPYETPAELTIEEIKETIQDFAKGSLLAKEAGFDGVEIHSANGYLVDEFLQSSTNQRTDEYGGSKENRVRILEEIVQAIIDSGAYPANRIGFRLSPNGSYGDMGSDDNHIMFPFVAETMSKYGLAYLHAMDGLGFGFHGKSPAVTAFDLKKNFKGPVIVNIGLNKDIAEGMIRSGAADLAAFGRLYISNPDLPERFANNWPVEPEAPYESWWRHTAEKGYTDWPKYEPSEAAEA